MGGNDLTLDRRTARDLLQWWVDAGVDVAVAEEPRQWLRAPTSAAPPEAQTVAVPAEAPTSEPAAVQEEYAAFRAWLETGTGLPFDQPGARRILPRGEAGAEIMVLCGPGSEDGDQVLAGEAWALTVRMLAAIGLRPEQSYIAPLVCFAAPGVSANDAALRQCAAIARHHVALVAPKRLLLFGDGPARAMTGEPLGKARGRVHSVGGVHTVATFSPRSLLAKPEQKSWAWRDLLLLMEEEL